METNTTNIHSFLKNLKTASNLTGPSEVDKLPDPPSEIYLKAKVDEMPIPKEAKEAIVNIIKEEPPSQKDLEAVVTVDSSIIKTIETDRGIQSVVVNTKDFLNRLNAAAKLISKRCPSPILSSIRLEAFGHPFENKNQLRVQSTDLEVYFQSVIEIKEGANFDILLDAKKIIEIAKTITTPEVCLKIQKDREMLTVVGQFSMEMPYSASLDNWPELPSNKIDVNAMKGETAELNNANIKTADFMAAVTQVEYARSTDAVRPVYTNLHLESEHGETRLAATDGRRLAVAKLSCEINTMHPDLDKFPKRFKNILIPECVTESIKALKTNAEYAAFSFLKKYERPTTDKPSPDYEIAKHIILMLGDKCTGDTRYVFASEGIFPNIDAVIPETKVSKVTFASSKDAFTKAIAALKPIWKDNAHRCLTFYCRPNSIHIGAKNQSTAKVIMPVTEKASDVEMFTLSGAEVFTITLDAKYLLELVNGFDKKAGIHLEMSGPMSPIVASLKDRKGTVHILMPIRPGV